MNLVMHIPDELAARLGTGEADIGRQALEALALEKFRAGLLNKDELAQMLGLDGLDQVDGFLKRHDVYEPCTIDDVHCDIATLVRLGF